MKTETRLIISAYKEKYRLQKAIDDAQLEVLAIQHELTGLARHGTPMTPEQERSGKPMPKTVSPTHSDQHKLSLIERKDELEANIDYLTMAMTQADKVKRLDVLDQEIMQCLYHSRLSVDDVADRYGYTRKALYRHLYSAIDKVC